MIERSPLRLPTPSQPVRVGWPVRTQVLGCGLAALLMVAGCGAPPPNDPSDPPSLDETDLDGDSGSSASPEVEEAARAIESGDFDHARAKLEAVLAKAPEDAQANYYYALVQEQAGDAQAAAKHYLAALKSDPKLPEAAVNLSSLVLEGQPEQALKVVEQALSHTPGHPGLLLNHALVLEALGRQEEALVAYGKAVQADPDNSELRFAYGDLLAAAGKNEEAKRELMAIVTDDVKVLGAVGAVLGKVEAFAECVAVLDKAIKESPLPQLFVRRAACKNGLKDIDGATRDYKEAIQLEPESAAGHLYLGRHLASAGKKAEARASLQQAVKIDGDGKVGQAAKELLKKL
ncbi:MAG: tetratricopeptide repeat protein [Polyangiaceae bacterium]|nr:tetratricopeptide repeat protein [Polyangiaceae bacterium]MCW5791314.1 tetratricopeptide repeat protein [Polyangiaceae bacterium]